MLAKTTAARTLTIDMLSISPKGQHSVIYYLSFIIVQKYIYDYACMGVALVSRFFFIAKTASCIRCTSLRAPAGLAHSLFWLVAVQFWFVAVLAPYSSKQANCQYRGARPVATSEGRARDNTLRILYMYTTAYLLQLALAAMNHRTARRVKRLEITWGSSQNSPRWMNTPQAAALRLQCRRNPCRAGTPTTSWHSNSQQHS